MNHEPMSRATPLGDTGDRRKDVGSLLRASRLRCGEELEDVAQVLRIRRRHMQAIEDGDFDSLPGSTYAVGFIRAYADYLGLDSDEVVRRFKEGQTTDTGKQKKTELAFPSPMSETGVPRGAVVFLGVLIGLVVYGGWYASTVDNDFFKQWIEPVPARLAALLPNNSDAPVPGAENQPASTIQNDAEPNVEAAVKTAPPVETTKSAPAVEVPAEMAKTEEAASDLSSMTAQTSDAVASSSAAVQSAAVAVTDAADTVPSVSEDNSIVSTTTDAASKLPAQSEAATAAGTEPADPSAVPNEPAAVQATVAESVTTTAPTTAVEPAAPAQSSASETPVSESEPTAAPAAVPNPLAPSQIMVTTEQAATSVDATSSAAPASTEVSAATAPATAAPATGTRIVVTAISDSWVEIRELRSDEWVWGKLLRAGESYSVPNRDDLKLKSGNAGGLTISVDGTNVPPIGASGEVVRNVLLDPARLKAGRAVFR